MRLETFVHWDATAVIPYAQLRPMEQFLQTTPFSFQKHSATALRSVILDFLSRDGWSSNVAISPNSKINVTAMKGATALALQTGNMGRFYADLLKLQLLFHQAKAKAAIYILPSKDAARDLGENIANFDRFVEELRIFSGIITIPTYVIGLGKDRA